MADLRYDPISGTWVAIASKRRERPMEFIPIEQLHQQIICPFCSGNEEETPALIMAYRDDGTRLNANADTAFWSSRVVPNKYPSLSQAASLTPSGPYQCSATDGVQELVIPTPRHVSSISELTSSEMEVCLKACQDRVAAIRELSAIEHVTMFMNCRSAAGASLEHIHFQIMGTPVLSQLLDERTKRNQLNIKSNGESLVASLLAWEMKQASRIIRETENFVLLCPFASRFSFQVWIVPKNPVSPFDCAGEEKRVNAELSKLCIGYIQKLEQLLDHPAYNLLVNLAPTKYRANEHWFVEIFPRLSQLAGYELGTGVWVNPVSPEVAARRLSS